MESVKEAMKVNERPLAHLQNQICLIEEAMIAKANFVLKFRKRCIQ
jgi:hypothetical protein